MIYIQSGTSVLVIGPDHGVVRLFRNAGAEIVHCVGDILNESISRTVDADAYDLVVFTGGEDISPRMYNHTHYFNVHNQSVRDIYEMDVFKQCVASRTPIVGICRGAQMLCALNGGWLIQDAGGHMSGPHEVIDTVTGQRYMVTSDHHQMMVPNGSGDVIAYAPGLSSNYYHTAEGPVTGDLTEECEIVLWRDTLTLGHQPHPEWELESPDGNEAMEYKHYFMHTVNELLILARN